MTISGNTNINGSNGSSSRINACIHSFIQANHLGASAVPLGAFICWRTHQPRRYLGIMRHFFTAYTRNDMVSLAELRCRPRCFPAC